MPLNSKSSDQNVSAMSSCLKGTDLEGYVERTIKLMYSSWHSWLTRHLKPFIAAVELQ